MPRSALVALVLLLVAEAAGSVAPRRARVSIRNRTDVPMLFTLSDAVYDHAIGDYVGGVRGYATVPAHARRWAHAPDAQGPGSRAILDRDNSSEPLWIWQARAQDAAGTDMWFAIRFPEQSRPRVWRLTVLPEDLEP